MEFPQRLQTFRVSSLLAGLVLLGSPATAQDRTYSTSGDFDQGTLFQVNHADVADQLQLDSRALEFPFVWVVKTGRKSIVRIDARTGEILGEYRTAPDFRAGSPSRTAVDAAGNVWVGNRAEGAGGQGSVVKVGLVIGGSRGRKNADGSFSVDPNGGYLAPPFLYSTGIDRDGDGLIRTSRGLGDILAWADLGDGAGGSTAEVQDADDECILLYQRTSATDIHHVSLAADGRVWVGGFQNGPTGFDVLDPATGRLEGSMLPSCGGYAGVNDAAGVLWSAAYNQGTVLRYDPVSGATSCLPVPWAAGIAIDGQGYVWCSMWDRNAIAKLTPEGSMVTGFPKLTGGRNAFGLAVTPDGDVWVANRATNDVSRLDGAGNVRKRLAAGLAPTGVDVDASGKVWVVNQNSHDVVRIDPQAGPDGLGAVDLTVALGSGAAPIASGDMAAQVEVREFAATGTWTVVVDGEGAAWETLVWSSREAGNSRIEFHLRADDETAALPAREWVGVANGQELSSLVGRWLEIRATFHADMDARVSPVLLDVRVATRPISQEPPDCSAVVASVDRLWPPDGRMVPVGIEGPNGAGMACRITRIMQDEPVRGGSGDRTGADARGVGTQTAYLRAERDGHGNGRVYMVFFVVADGHGGECEGQVMVCVPHDMGRRDSCSNDGMLFDSTLEETGTLDADNFPNPFNPSTTIRYHVPAASSVRLVVYDALGRRVRTLVTGAATAGTHAVSWDGRDHSGREVPSGVYVYHVQAGGHAVSRRMLLLK